VFRTVTFGGGDEFGEVVVHIGIGREQFRIDSEYDGDRMLIHLATRTKHMGFMLLRTVFPPRQHTPVLDSLEKSLFLPPGA
jgi:hypothetical protein